MNIADDFDTFEIRSALIFKRGLAPTCDHHGLDQGHFCCAECSHPLFDLKDCIFQSSMFYSFSKAIDLNLIDLNFDCTHLIPQWTISCIMCGHKIGISIGGPETRERKYSVYARQVYLKEIS